MKANLILLSLARQLAWAAKEKRRVTPLTSKWVEGHAAGAFSTARITLQIHLKEFPRKVRMQVGAAIRQELNLGGAQ